MARNCLDTATLQFLWKLMMPGQYGTGTKNAAAEAAAGEIVVRPMGF
jgi:hypothetical protein